MASSDTAKVLYASKLKLSGEREDRLMTFCKNRRMGIREEMGFLDGIAASSGLGYQAETCASWRGMALTGWARIRFEAHRSYENDLSFRASPENAVRFGTLYQLFNCSMNIPQRAVNVYKARACEALVNTEPFTGLLPEGENDDSVPIKLAERILHSELKKAGARFEYREGIRQACLSEAVMKHTLVPVEDEPYMDNYASFWMVPEIGLGGPTGNSVPLRDLQGGYVFADEDFDAHPDILGLQILKRDPSVTMDPEQASKSEPSPMTRPGKVQYKISVEPTGWENFFCSVVEKDIHTADCIAHEFDEDVDNLLKRSKGMKLNAAARQWLENVKESSSYYPQSEGMQPNYARGEREGGLYSPKRVLICEQWLRFDVFERGVADELCVMWAVDSNGNEAWPIYYDLMKNASPTGRRPFEVIRVIPVRDRWYGMGFYDLLSNDHEFIDDAWNRIRFRSSASGRIEWIKKDAFEGTPEDGPQGLSMGQPLILKSTAEGNGGDNVGIVEFPEMDEKIWEMLKMAMQVAQLRSGTMTASDAAMSNLPSNNTATGQDLLANESELMSNDTTQDVIRGIQRSLEQCTIMVFDLPDPFAKQQFMEKANILLGVADGTTLMDWLAVHDAHDLCTNVNLLLTKARSKQQMQSGIQALQVLVGGLSFIQLVMQFPELAEQYKPLYADILHSLDISSADKLLQIPTEMLQMAQQQAQAAAGAAPKVQVKQSRSESFPTTAKVGP